MSASYQIQPRLQRRNSRVDHWKQRFGQDSPGNLCIITGPSHISDIEKTLVMGAHGPKRLAVYFVG
jgi:L-lactate utilization protein LutC